MKKNILFLLLVFVSTNVIEAQIEVTEPDSMATNSTVPVNNGTAENGQNWTDHYYADGVPIYWTTDSTSVNIIVKNAHNYNAIVQNLELLFSDSTDLILADDDDDNIIINSSSLPLMHKDSIITAISIAPDDIVFLTYSKLVDNRRIWLRNEVLVKLKNERAFWPRMDSVMLNSGVKSIEYIENREYSIICYTENGVATLASVLDPKIT